MPTISYDAWLSNVGGVDSDDYNSAVSDFDGQSDEGSDDGLQSFKDALEDGLFAPLLQKLEALSTSDEDVYQDVYIGDDLLDIGSFSDMDLSSGFVAANFSIQTFRDVLFLHLARNLLLDDPNTEYLDIMRNPEAWQWQPTSENDFHNFGEGFENTFKVVSADGHQEYIFYYVDGQFELVTDPRNSGGYNFEPSTETIGPEGPSEGELALQIAPESARSSSVSSDSGHFILDIAPWIAFGNSVDDPTGYEERASLEGSGITAPAAFDSAESPTEGSDADDEIEGPQSLRAEINGGAGNDTIQGDQQNDTIDGGSGFDFVSYENSTTGVAVNLGAGIARHGAGGYDNEPELLNSIEGAIGSSSGDIIIGSSGSNILDGGAGSDVLDGMGGIDTAIFSGASAQYTVASQNGGGVQVTNTVTNEVDIIYNIEQLRFDDITTDLSLSPVLAGVALLSGLGGEAGFGENALGANDDESTEEIDLTSIFEDGLNFFGREFTSLWVNNNGSVTFNGPRDEFTPEVITLNEDNPEITPFFADVDTSGAPSTVSPGGTSTGSNRVYYDFDTANDRFIVTWDDVGYFEERTELTNAFQLVLTDRGDGDFDIQYRYEDVQWTTGEASDGENGLGGIVARAGFTASTGDPDAYFELPASGNQEAMLALDEVEGNSGQIGIWEFSVRSGDINSAELPELPDLTVWATASGDPHLVTLDGVAYDFHAAGEFVLLRATNSRDFEVQSRMTPVADTENLTVNSAIALRFGGSNVMVDSTDNNAFSIDGVVTEIPNFSSLAVGDDTVFRSNNVFTFVFAGGNDEINDGDSQVVVTVEDNRVDFAAYLDADLLGNLEGLLGDGDGNAENDITYSDGTTLDRPLNYNDVYGQYKDDWRVDTAGDSLFTYDGGESLAGFYLPDYPAEIASVDDYSPEAVATARTAILDAGLEEGTVAFNNALIDFLATGDQSYIGAAEDTAEVSIEERLEVIRENRAPTSLSVSSTTVSENAAGSTVVGQVSVVDPDSGDTHTFSLINDAGGLFTLDGTNLVVNGEIDFEAASSHEVTLRATDVEGLSVDKTITINVNNVNEAPTTINLDDTDVDENTVIATAIGALTVADPDVGDTHTFSLVNDAGGLFAVDGTDLVVDGVIDFEVASSHEITVRATDAGGLSADQTITINVNNVDEAPTTINLDDTDVDENTAIATAIGALTVADPDVGDTHTFSLVNDAGGLFAVDGTDLVVDGVIDFEVASSHEITVRATDAGGLSADQTITISVNDLLDVLNFGPGDDEVMTGFGGDAINLGGGRDKVLGPVVNFFDDQIGDFAGDDQLIFTDETVERSQISVSSDSAVLAIDTDNDGNEDGSFALGGDFSTGDFMAVKDGANTVVTFETFLPELQEGRALDEFLVNGVVNQDFLTGDGSTDFQVTLRDMGFAGYDNVLGVYEIDASGNILDTRILLENANTDKTAIAGITDVEAGNSLGFFLVQRGAAWASTLAEEDTLSFVNGSQAAANISDGSDISIAVNGVAEDAMIFHSFSEDMNPDGVQHATSGVDEGGESITIGFEDLFGGGDRDYEDVVFSVELVDDFVFV